MDLAAGFSKDKMKEALDLIFPKNLIREPIIYKMSKEIPIVFNIRRAKVTDKVGEIVLELDGTDKDLEKAKDWLKNQGVKIQPITGDTFEG